MSQVGGSSGHTTAEGTDRRDAQRVEILGTLRADILVSQPLVIADISNAGFQVVTSFPLLLDSVHELRLTLDDRTLVLKGRIVHSAVADVDGEGVRYRSGISLEDAPETVRTIIGGYAEKLRRLRAGD